MEEPKICQMYIGQEDDAPWPAELFPDIAAALIWAGWVAPDADIPTIAAKASAAGNTAIADVIMRYLATQGYCLKIMTITLEQLLTVVFVREITGEMPKPADPTA